MDGKEMFTNGKRAKYDPLPFYDQSQKDVIISTLPQSLHLVFPNPSFLK
jgi:hypothetical protein